MFRAGDIYPWLFYWYWGIGNWYWGIGRVYEIVGFWQLWLLNPPLHQWCNLFASKLGITIENAELLKQALKKAAINEDVAIQKTNEYGTYYIMN